jgi:hypothetical protein
MGKRGFSVWFSRLGTIAVLRLEELRIVKPMLCLFFHVNLNGGHKFFPWIQNVHFILWKSQRLWRVVCALKISTKGLQ